RQEDRADLAISVHSHIVDVRNPDGTAVSDDLRAQLSADATLNYTLDLYFSNVGTPSINSDPQLEAWLQQWRSQVNRAFPWPFEFSNIVQGLLVLNPPPPGTLIERSLNGQEKVMLSRATLTF